MRSIISSQLFKSFIQTPSIIDSPYFPQIMELINELRRSQSPDILQAIRFLASTGIRFSPLLECIITELMEEDGESERPRETRDFSDDVEL